MLRPWNVASLALVLTSATAWAHDEDPQQHEVRADVDISVENKANAALIDAQYTFTPQAIDRRDEVVPILRRFVRHPSALWLRLDRNGGTFDTQTSVHGGGTLQLLGGHLYATGEAGFEYDEVKYDPQEAGYFTVPFRVEVGGRPTSLLSVGAFYEARPVVDSNTDTNAFMPTHRAGGEQAIGATMTMATDNDRFTATLSASYYMTDWTFSGFHPGDLTVRGLHAAGSFRYQTSSSFSLGLSLELQRDNWVDGRQGDELSNFIGPDLDTIVYSASGTFDLIFWQKGHIGFRASLGGGYLGRRLLVNDVERGMSRFGLGLIVRF